MSSCTEYIYRLSTQYIRLFGLCFLRWMIRMIPQMPYYSNMCSINQCISAQQCCSKAKPLSARGSN